MSVNDDEQTFPMKMSEILPCNSFTITSKSPDPKFLKEYKEFSMQINIV